MFIFNEVQEKIISNFMQCRFLAVKLLLLVTVVPDYFPSQYVLFWQLPNLETGSVVGPDFFTLTWRKM
jgi:hypothetical protein